MEQGESFYPPIEEMVDDQVQELIGRYDPGPVFKDWVKQFKTALTKHKWNSELEIGQAVAGCMFWIKCLLKTWREEVGPSEKQNNFLWRNKSYFRADLRL